MAVQLTWFHHTSPLNIRWVETVSCGAKSELLAGGGIISPKGFSFLLLRSFLCPPPVFNNFCLTIQSTRPVVTFLFLHLFIRSFPGTVFRIIQMTRSDGKLFVPWWCVYRLEASLKQFRNAFTTWDITQRTVLISCPSISVARISCLHCEFGIEEEEEELAFSQLFTYLFGKQTQANRIPNWNRLVPLTTTCSHSSSGQGVSPNKRPERDLRSITTKPWIFFCCSAHNAPEVRRRNFWLCTESVLLLLRIACPELESSLFTTTSTTTQTNDLPIMCYNEDREWCRRWGSVGIHFRLNNSPFIDWEFGLKIMYLPTCVLSCL